ncbi:MULTISPECIES: hypothetical protein [unclassified Ornithinimicrobium]|uniref:hypothetical protein n=1 Tax=unclassified Ornithinimicrobium TaxID=2615080 RepID=UPI0038552169
MRTRTVASTTIATVAAAIASLGIAGSATAAHDDNPSSKVGTYTYTLAPVQADSVPNSQGWGSTRITALPNGKVQVQVRASGLAPGLPHAMHLHGETDMPDMGCPGPAADGGDGIVSVVDGLPSYGGILASLTTTGDTTAASALALDRYPVADATGRISYTRTFVDEQAWANADTVQVVVHGIDINGNGAYDFEAGPSSLTSAAPLEATIPALCGGIAN